MRDRINDVVTAQAKMSGFDDEDLSDAFTNIVRVTGDVEKALTLNNLAMDIARGKQLDVAKAGELVGKVAGGNTGILARYGIVIEKGASASEALGTLQQKFAGQAERYGQSTAGALDRAQVAIENLGESVGMTLAPHIATLANAAANLLPKLELMATSISDKVQPRIQALAAVVQRNMPAIQRVFEMLVEYWRTTWVPIFRDLARIAGETIQRIVAVLQRHEPEIRRIFTNLGKIIQNLWAIAGPIIKLLFEEVLPRAIEVAIVALDKVARVFGVLSTVIRRAVGFVVGVFEKWLGAIQAVVEGASHIPGIGGKFKGVASDIGKAREKLRGFKNELDTTKDKKITVTAELRFRTPGGGGFRDGVVSFDQALNQGASSFASSTAVMPPAQNPGGLSPWVLDELSIGNALGLRLTSGYRPGAITSSGRKSLHSVGQAIDMSGDPMSMAMFANSVAGRSGVAEVIYTPVGAWYPGAGWTRPSG
ncbi:MAG: hypothetical protein ACRDWG_00695, partial [Actinomycetes bacterium]